MDLTDPFILHNPQQYQFDKLVTTATDPYTAVKGAIVITCTEWDEFTTLDYTCIFDSMLKLAWG